jgi:hypothetical protein
MHSIKLEKPESPFLRYFPINMDGNISPVFMVEFQSTQPKSNASTYGFNKSFFETPVPIEEQSDVTLNISMIFLRLHCHDLDL